MPESDAEARSPRSKAPAVRFRRPATDALARAARRAVRGGRASFSSLVAFRKAVLETLRRDEPLFAVGDERLRRLLVDVPGIRLAVRYTEREGAPLPTVCPVCGSPLGPIRNRTLTGETIELGRECPRCSYWTHAVRRVPVRYHVSSGSPRRSRAAASATRRD